MNWPVVPGGPGAEASKVKCPQTRGKNLPIDLVKRDPMHEHRPHPPERRVPTIYLFQAHPSQFAKRYNERRQQTTPRPPALFRVLARCKFLWSCHVTTKMKVLRKKMQPKHVLGVVCFISLLVACLPACTSTSRAHTHSGKDTAAVLFCFVSCSWFQERTYEPRGTKKWKSKAACPTHQIVRMPRQVTIQAHQTLRLPWNVTLALCQTLFGQLGTRQLAHFCIVHFSGCVFNNPARGGGTVSLPRWLFADCTVARATASACLWSTAVTTSGLSPDHHPGQLPSF